MQNALKDHWAAGRPVLNGWLGIGNGFVAEIMAAQPYDALTVDWQHGALDYSDLLPMFQAIRASGVVPMARVPWLDPSAIMKALDAGAMGIICPMINTPAEARAFVSYMRYPPLGQRSFGPTRASVAMPGYGLQANDAVLAFAMIETAEGLRNLDEIAATPGLDGIYVGPSDLSIGVSNGQLAPGMDREEDEMIAHIRRIAEVCADKGIVAGIHCDTPGYAARAVSWGYGLTTVGNDNKLLAQAAGDAVQEWRAATGCDAATDPNAGGY